MKIPKRPDRRDDVAGLQAENVSGADPGRAVLSGRRRGEADIEAQRALGGRVMSEGVVVAAASGRVARDQVKGVPGLPDGSVRRGDVEIAEADLAVGRDVKLQIAEFTVFGVSAR